MRILVLLLAISIFIISACSTHKSSLDTYTSTMDREVTFNKDIMPILDRSCLSCHSGDSKLDHFDDMDEVKEEIGEIIERVELDPSNKKYMPYKQKQPGLSPEEIKLFKEWAVKGFKK